jgi:hypothetical protein
MMTAAMATMATVEAATITHPSFSRDLLVKTSAEPYDLPSCVPGSKRTAETTLDRFSVPVTLARATASAHVGPMIRFKHRAVDDQWFVTAISPAMPAA